MVGGQGVGDGADLLDHRQHRVVFGTQFDRGGDVLGGHRDGVHFSWEDGAQGDADGQLVDDFLVDRAGGGWQQPGGGGHRHECSPMPTS